MAIIFTYLLFNIIFNNHNYLTNIKALSLVLFSAFYLIIVYLINKALNKYIKNSKKYIIISTIIFIILQLIFAYIFAVIPEWDFGAIYYGAIQNITGKIPFHKYNYLYIYQNNIGYGLLLSLIFYPIKLIGLNNYMAYGIVGIILNIICIDVSLLTLLKIIRQYFEKTQQNIFWLLALLYTPFITYVPIFYTDTLSLPFIVGGVYFILKIINNEKNLLNIAISGLLLGIAYTLKPTAIIIIIAFIIFYSIFTNEHIIKRLTTISIILVAFALPLISLNIYKQIYFDQQKIEEKSFPITHWLMMGLKGNGGYNQEDVDYTSSFIGKENKKQANIKIINKRIKELVKEKKIISFYTNKALYVWGDGTYYAPAKLSVNPIKDLEIKGYILPTGKNKIFILIAQCQLVLTILFIILGIILRKYLSKQQQKLQLFLNISIFGIFLFELIWEARSRYLVNMIPILLLSCYLGVTATIKFIQSKKVEE